MNSKKIGKKRNYRGVVRWWWWQWKEVLESCQGKRAPDFTSQRLCSVVFLPLTLRCFAKIKRKVEWNQRQANKIPCFTTNLCYILLFHAQHYIPVPISFRLHIRQKRNDAVGWVWKRQISRSKVNRIQFNSFHFPFSFFFCRERSTILCLLNSFSMH